MIKEFNSNQDLIKALENGGVKKVMWVCPITGKAFDPAFPEKIEEHKQALIQQHQRDQARRAEAAAENERRRLAALHSKESASTLFQELFSKAVSTKDVSEALEKAVRQTIPDQKEAEKVSINVRLATDSVGELISSPALKGGDSC